MAPLDDRLGFVTPSRFLPLRRSARATLWCAAASAVLTVATFWLLEEWLGALALAALAGFVLCALYAILGMNRYAVAGIAAATTAATIGCALAFLRILGVAWDDAPDTVTTVSSRDADPYFYGAAGAFAATLCVLFVGAAWPRRRRPNARRPGQGRPAQRVGARPASTSPRASGVRTTPRAAPQANAPKTTLSKGPAQPAPKKPAQRPSANGGRGASGSRPSAPRKR